MKLVQLTARHRPILEKVLLAEPLPNTLLLSRLRRLGDDPAIAFWVMAGEGMKVQAIAGLDGADWVLTNPGQADLYPLAQVILGQGPGRLRGEVASVGALLRHLGIRVDSDHNCLLVRLPGKELPEAEQIRPGARIQKIAQPDLAPWQGFWIGREVEEASRLERALATGGRALALFLGDEPAAVAWTEAETADTAMIGGIHTAPDKRGQGLGTTSLRALCAELIAGGLAPIMLYDCPAIGRMAGQIGFTPYGRWRQLTWGESR